MKCIVTPIAARIRMGRELRGLTVEKVAERVPDLFGGIITMIEAGAIAPTRSVLLDIAGALDVSFVWLLTGVDVELLAQTIETVDRIRRRHAVIDSESKKAVRAKAQDIAETYALAASPQGVC